MLEACTKLCKFPMLMVRDIDVRALLYGDGIEAMPRFGYMPPKSEEDLDMGECSQSSSSTIDAPDDGITVYRIFDRRTTTEQSQVLSVGIPEERPPSYCSTQDEYLQAEVDIASSQLTIVSEPTLNNDPIEAFDDPDGTLFLNQGHFMRRLWRILGQFDEDSQAYLHEPITSHQLTAFLRSAEDCGPRFKFIPVIDDVAFLLITDSFSRRWLYMNPDRRPPKYTGSFDDINVAFQSSEKLNDYCGSIFSISSFFHEDYVLMHLLYATRELVRTYNDFGVVPIMAIYQERDFRRFCYECCLEQELVNLRYNQDKDLIDNNGLLKPGGYRHSSCPVSYTAAVVKMDQCIYCGKRYSKNKGAHINAAHKGGALRAREARRAREQLEE